MRLAGGGGGAGLESWQALELAEEDSRRRRDRTDGTDRTDGMDREQRGAGVNGDVRFGGERVRVRSLGVPRASGERLVGALRVRGRAVILAVVQSLRLRDRRGACWVARVQSHAIPGVFGGLAGW